MTQKLRIVLVGLVVSLLSQVSFAQKKGDMYVAGSFATDFGAYTMSSSADGYATSEKTPFGTSFEIGGDYAYLSPTILDWAWEYLFPSQVHLLRR